MILSIGLLLSRLLKGKVFCRYLVSILNIHSGICGCKTRGTTLWCCCYYVDFQRRMWAGLACGTIRSGVNWVISFWESAGVIWTLYAPIKCQKMDEKAYWKTDACFSCLLGLQKQAAQRKTVGFGRVYSQMSLEASCLLGELWSIDRYLIWEVSKSLVSYSINLPLLHVKHSHSVLSTERKTSTTRRFPTYVRR